MLHIQKITNEAKRIRKAHPSKKWVDCVKAASKRIGKAKPAKKAAKKRAVKKAAPRKRITGVRTTKKAVSKRPVGVGKAGIVSGLETKLGALAVRHFKAKLKRDKTKLAKELAEVKKKLRSAHKL